MKKTYRDKLRDPRWQRVRLLIFERDGWQCVHCGAKDKELHVHHFAYVGKDPWDTPKWLLRTLCRDCHDTVPTCTCHQYDCGKRNVHDVCSMGGQSCGEKWCGFSFCMEGHVQKCDCFDRGLSIPITRMYGTRRAVRPPEYETCPEEEVEHA